MMVGDSKCILAGAVLLGSDAESILCAPLVMPLIVNSR